MDTEKSIFDRVSFLLGKEVLQDIHTKKVIIFGVGGVGSWCVESLVRTGICHLTIVDFDDVCITNVNRQLMATSLTVGQSKVEVLKNRLLEINPQLDITVRKEKYVAENADTFHLQEYDYIIDAIDSIDSKVHLIQAATNTDATFYSSMGAALKIDPTRIQVADFWKVHGCPLAASLRRRLKKGEKLRKSFQVVFSDELIRNKKESPSGDQPTERQPNGSLMFVTATAGLTLASLVIRDIAAKSMQN